MEDSSIFGAKSNKLDKLLRLALEKPDAESEPTPTASLDTLTEKPGGRIDKYKLLRILGEGGMGIVYLAQQEEPVRREVALKVIKPGMDSKRVIARFKAEKQALALMQHPHIAGVYDAGLTLTGRPYFVMECVKGISITDYCDQHKLTITGRLDLFVQVCQAVQHAHQKGIIHRDIKPSNILVSMDNDRAVPKIIDFGVAKATGKPLTERTLQTEDSQLLGTPEYMSPEQADMAIEDIDTRSDVYSLGVLLYVLLTGVLPYESETLREGGIEKIRRTIRETDPKTPSTRLTSLGEEAAKVAEMRCTEIRALKKHLRNELEWIPLKAMRKERSERYQSASELADDIENYLKGTPLIAGPLTNLYRLRKFVRRNAGLSVAVVAAVVTLLLGLVAISAMYLRAERARAEAQSIADFLTQDVLGGVRGAESYQATISYVIDAASESLQGKFRDQPLVEASIRNTLGWTYHYLAEQAKAEPHLERALQLFEEHLGEEHPQTLQVMGRLGWVYMAHMQLEDAYRVLSWHRRTLKRIYGREVYSLGLGCLYSSMARYDDAEAMFLKILENVDREQDLDAYSYGNLARVYIYQGRYEEAEHLLLNIPGVDKAEPEVKSVLPYSTNLADVYYYQGRYKEAEESYKTALEKMRLAYGERHYATLITMVSLAQLYTVQGRYPDANELFSQVIEFAQSSSSEMRHFSYPGTPRSWPDTLCSLAILRTRQGYFDEAERLFSDALNGWQQLLGDLSEDHPAILRVINGFGVLRRDQRQYEEAESLLHQALDGRLSKLGNDHPACFETLHELAVLYKEQGDYNRAEKLLLEAIKGRRLKLGDTHPHTLESWNSLIELYEARGKPEKAGEWREKLQQTKAVNE